METLLAARLIMAISLGFHIIFASIGIAMPFFMFASYASYLRHGNEVDLQLTKMWSKGVAILFAVGAVSGTVLSFELGLLWPHFMKLAGPIFGMPFSWEGTAFFLEAIAIGIFLYGWNRLPPRLHLFSALVVGLSGLASGIFILSANAWMNAPTGFDWNQGQPTNIDPIAAMFNSAWLQQALHMQIAAFVATGFAAAGAHAYFILQGTQKKFNWRGFQIAISFAAVASFLAPISGHYSAQWVAENQPAKLAAMEALYETTDYAPLLIGGIPNDETREVRLGFKIPGALSFLAFNRFDAEVKGLDQFPREQWPPVLPTHLAFQLMVAIGSSLMAVSLLCLWAFWKSKWPRSLLKLLVCCSPLGFIAIEAGWIVTEVGRQPWIIYELLKTKDSVTDVPGIGFHLISFSVIYAFLAFMVVYLMKRLMSEFNKKEDSKHVA